MTRADRQCQLVSLVGILLAFLSGSFSLSRLGFPGFRLRYAFFIASVTALLAFIARNARSAKVSQSSKRFLFLFYGFVVYAAFSLLWLNDVTTGIPKFVDIVFLFAILFALSLVIDTFDHAQEIALGVAYFFVLVGVVYAFQIFLNAISPDSYRGEVYTAGYNVQTRVLFMAVCSSLFLSACRGGWKYRTLVWLFLTAIILLASKQGIVAGVVVLLLYLMLRVSNSSRSGASSRARIPTFISAIEFLAAVSVISAAAWLYRDKIRLIVAVTDASLREFYLWHAFASKSAHVLVETGTRGRLFVNSIAAIREHPWFGMGLAGYLDVASIGFYPHNIVLEFALDGGIPGAVFFLFFLIYGIHLIVKTRKSIYLPFALIPPYMLIVSCASGGLYDFRYYFMWILILLRLTYKRRSGTI